MWLIDFFKSLFSKKEPAPAMPNTAKPTPSAPIEIPPATTFSLAEWTKRALILSQKFEGSDAFANITGAFDSAVLTCGALGWTIRWENQDPLWHAFVDRHGEARGRQLMPTKWDEYKALILASGDTALAMARKWSDANNSVKEPYRSELRAFWKSPEMVAIQGEFAQKDMGAYAEKMMRQFCEAHQIPPSFKVFAWFFDIKVHNGGMKDVGVSAGKGYTFPSLRAWAAKLVIPARFKNTKVDLDKNITLWGPMFDKLSAWEKSLIGISQLRSAISNVEFKADVMNRKGSIAFGKGYVHGSLYDFSKDFGEGPAVAQPTTPDPVPQAGIEKVLRDDLVLLWESDLDERESNGKNRSPMIDSINKRLGVPMGSPYCIGGLLVRGVEVLCKSHGLKNPVTMTAGTQDFYFSTPTKYRKPIGQKGKKADIAIQVNRSDADHGHAYGLTEDQVNDLDQKSIEYNTDGSGGRDGDGVYKRNRSQNGDSLKRYRGCVDVVQWIIDANPGLK